MPKMSPHGTASEIIMMFAICVAQLVVMEVVGHIYIYSKDEFKDAQERARNLGRRLKKLKYEYLYVPSNKKKQEGKMIKVQEENFKEAHREITALKSRFTMGSAAFSMVLTYIINSIFWNKVSASIPFEPWKMVTGMSHRGLEGEDMS